MTGGNSRNTGDLAARRRRRTRLWVGLALAVLVSMVASVALIVQPWSPEFQHGGLTVAAPPAPVAVDPQVDPAPSNATAPSASGIRAALAGVVANPDLGAFSGQVTDADSGAVLWSGGQDTPMIPSSTLKVLTTAAALLALPADSRVTTQVVAGAAPNEAVLVAAGDPTITARPDGKGYYPGAAKLADLAAGLQGRGIDTIVVDTSSYTGPTMAKGWEAADIPGGSIAPLEPVMIDGGRLDPLVEYAPRSTTPALDAGRQLATQLGLDPGKVELGTAAPGAAELASVRSAPLRDRLRQLMVWSDNVLAETVGREVAAARGLPQSFDGAADAVRAVLTEAGFDLTGVSMHDSSGLSVDDRVPARVLAAVLTAAAEPTGAAAVQPAGTSARPERGARSATLAPLLDTLPVAGATGSLASRYTGGDPAGAGWIRAKTGTLSVASALVGYVLDRDGRVLTFALMSNDRPPEVSRPALDAIAGTLRNCGCS
ncbi:D-alanyl-D-alanine carboxypeptidase/D-alanyl-D-alanine-endopeptidase [Nocardia sp. NPDC057353]|uniref:D-alanyl-D-alanine carboxypeptidase/D-alanyl-D-alanine endopeptidase n=1 Tax=Nocardia sp. NPDC057353 TaxID=3346104 RepID=UPI00362AFCED